MYKDDKLNVIINDKYQRISYLYLELINHSYIKKKSFQICYDLKDSYISFFTIKKYPHSMVVGHLYTSTII